MNDGGRVWLEIDMGLLKDNFRKIQAAVKPCSVLAVLKANAYGLGVLPIATALREAGAAGFGVAELNEALSLTSLGMPVQILGSIIPSEIPAAVEHGVIMPVGDLAIAEMISREALKQQRVAECHFIIDTGMGRLGALVAEAFAMISAAVKLPGLKCSGIYSHFPVANRPDLDHTLHQIERFRELLRQLSAAGIDFECVHIANSDAINNFPASFSRPFNRVRTGINLYGAFDPEGQRAMNLTPVLSLKTRLVAKRMLPAGSNIGYGCTYTLQENMLVGTIAAGYADGLPLNLSNRGYVLVNGCLCPVIGRISMDYSTVALTNVPGAMIGDEVICIGGEGARAITVDTMAQIKGTHAYDVCCSFGSRVERRYVN